jgi:hypothetical protein
MSQPKKVHIGVFHRTHPTDETNLEKYRLRAVDIALEVEHYWRYQSQDAWDVQSRGFSYISDGSVRPPGYDNTAIMAWIREHSDEMDGFKPNYFHVVDIYTANLCGQGNKPGDRSVTYTWSSCGQPTVIHELGHNMGLSHAGTLLNGRDVIYGDLTSCMGNPRIVRGLNAPHRLQLGFEQDREIVRIRETQQILLCPIELNKHSLHPNEYQIAIVGSGARKYFISNRKVRGTPYPEPYDTEGLLYVHTLKGTFPKRLLNDLKVGGTKSLPDGTVIEYLEYKRETARLNILFDDSIEVVKLDIPDGFPAPLVTAQLSQANAGSWFNRDYVGQGFHIMVKDNRVALYWYTFSQDYSDRVYYMAAGKVVNRHAVMDLYVSFGGKFEDPDNSEAEKIGSLQLYFLDSSHGMINFNTTLHGRGSVEIVPVVDPAVTDPSNPLTGAWFNPDKDGEGLSIHSYDDIGKVGLYWFTYGKLRRPLPGRPVDKLSTQRWFTGIGTPKGGGEYDMTLHETLGGRFLFYDEVDTQPVGTAVLRLIDDDTLELEYDIDASDTTGTGTLHLTRLF